MCRPAGLASRPWKLDRNKVTASPPDCPVVLSRVLNVAAWCVLVMMPGFYAESGLRGLLYQRGFRVQSGCAEENNRPLFAVWHTRFA